MNTYDTGGAKVDRRTLIKLLGAAGLAVPTAGFLTACATSGADAGTGAAQTVGTGPKDAQNPFGVKADAPLEFFNFEGGYGTEWPKFPAGMYREKFPEAEVTLAGSPSPKDILQPRFVQGNPPDLIYVSGLNIRVLAEGGQLAELGDLIDAPAIDDPNKKVKDLLVAGAAEGGYYNGKKYAQPYFNAAWGLWYSKSLFEKHGWEYPKTWDEMMALAPKIKAAGIAPWTHAGKAPFYIQTAILATASKIGGREVGVAVDNLEPNAWKNPALIEAANRFYELVKKGYMLEGSEAMTHTQSQTYWAEGQAAFIPVGSWLETEMGSVIPPDIEMALMPLPNSSAADKLPFEALQVDATGSFIVPSAAKNPAGGKEFLRMMLTKAAAKNFTTLAKDLTVVLGAADDVKGSPAFTSVREAINNSGGTNIEAMGGWNYGKWYSDLSAEVINSCTTLITGDIDGNAWADKIQKVADKVAADSSVTKYSRS